MLSSDKNSNKEIFFINGLNEDINYWHIVSNKITLTNFDKTKFLIDGELLMWGSVNIERSPQDNKIIRYRIMEKKTDKGSIKPFIIFLAFDIIYGPIKPEIKIE